MGKNIILKIFVVLFYFSQKSRKIKIDFHFSKCYLGFTKAIIGGTGIGLVRLGTYLLQGPIRRINPLVNYNQRLVW